MYKFYSAIEDYGDAVAIYIGILNHEGRVSSTLDKLEFREREEGRLDTPSPLTIRRREAQQLFDSLWEIGLRPSKEIGNEGMKKAMTDHIEDMRYVVKKLLDK